MWDESKMSVIEILKGGYSLSMKCKTICKKECWITNVYGLTDYRERSFVWLELFSLSDYILEPWCIGGDFNITRRPQERFPVGRLTKGMKKFNKFIEETSLLEIPLANGRFSWERDGTANAVSLIDRFFISKQWDEFFENTRVNGQARLVSDHFPLLLEAGSFV